VALVFILVECAKKSVRYKLRVPQLVDVFSISAGRQQQNEWAVLISRLNDTNQNPFASKNKVSMSLTD
jgi:hypothetical protein